MRALAILGLIVLALTVGARPAAAQHGRMGLVEARPGDTPPVVQLYTFGRGALIFEKFGHTALCLDYNEPERETVCFNYGVTDFTIPGATLTWRFIRGKQVFFVEPVKSAYALSELAMKATPLLLIALGLAVCFRSNVWNIGAEGQFVIGAIFAGGTAMQAGPETGRWFVAVVLLAIGLAGAPVLHAESLGQHRQLAGIVGRHQGEARRREPGGGEGDDPARLYVIGESTVAGLGARTHELALAGRFDVGCSRSHGAGAAALACLDLLVDLMLVAAVAAMHASARSSGTNGWASTSTSCSPTARPSATSPKPCRTRISMSKPWSG